MTKQVRICHGLEGDVMLVDLLDQSIIAMKEIYELEKSSNDVQKQEKNDKIFSNVVSENHLMVKAVTDSMSQLGFVISQESYGILYCHVQDAMRERVTSCLSRIFL